MKEKTISQPKSGGALANATLVTTSNRDRDPVTTTRSANWTNVAKPASQAPQAS
jgi:hypothetical protein